jgi:hypothetical protein
MKLHLAGGTGDCVDPRVYLKGLCRAAEMQNPTSQRTIISICL